MENWAWTLLWNKRNSKNILLVHEAHAEYDFDADALFLQKHLCDILLKLKDWQLTGSLHSVQLLCKTFLRNLSTICTKMVDRAVLSKILIVLIVLVKSSTYVCYNFLFTDTFNTFSKTHQVLLRWPKRLTSSTNQYEPFNDIQIPTTTKTASNQGTSIDVNLIKIRANLSQKLDEVLQNSTQQVVYAVLHCFWF